MRFNYRTDGFMLLSELAGSVLHIPVAASTKIEKGHAVWDNGSGYAIDTTADMSSLFLGIAAAEADNSSGAAAAIDVVVIPPLPQHKFLVPVYDRLLVITDRGTRCDLSAGGAGKVDVDDTTIASGPGFMIEDIDVSADAIAVNTYGYAIGHFDFVS